MALTIRLTPQEEKVIEDIKAKLNEKSAARALIRCSSIVLNDMQKLQQDYLKVRDERDNAVREYNEIMQILKEKQGIEKKLQSRIF